MEESDVIHALRCCIAHTLCQQCPMLGVRDCMTKLYTEALRIIETQKGCENT